MIMISRKCVARMQHAVAKRTLIAIIPESTGNKLFNKTIHYNCVILLVEIGQNYCFIKRLKRLKCRI